MNRPPYHIHVVAIQVLGICLMFFNECFFKNSELKFFFFTKIKDFFLSHFMSYYLHSAIENLYLRNAPTYANYDIPKKIFSDIFFFFFWEIYCRNTILMRYDTMRITRSIKEENYDMIYERGLGVSLYYKLLYLTTMFKNFKKNNNNPEKQLLLGLFEEKKKPIQNTPRTILSSSLLNTSMGYIHKEDFVDPILLFLLTLIYN